MLFILRFDLRNPAFAGVDMTDRYRAAIEMTEWAEQRGALAVSVSEHHGSADGYLPSPMVLAAAIAARTTTIAIAVNALIAPFHDPLRLAEDIAVVDRLSDGRMSVTIAAGYVAEEFDMFGVAMSERPTRMREMVATLRAAWTGEPFEFRGRTVRVTPTPAQPGGPPIVLGGSSEAAARRAARIGDGFVPSHDECWEFYRDECRVVGKPDPGPATGFDGSVVVLAEDPDAAWPVLGPYFMHETNAYGAWQTAAGMTTYRPVADLDALRADGQYRILTPDEYSAEMAAAGDLAFAKLHPMVGGIPPDLAWASLHLFEETFPPQSRVGESLAMADDGGQPVAEHADVRRVHGFHPLRVKAIIDETADTRSFVLDVPDDLREMFRYRAGQFCTFRVHVEGEELLRSYSMSSAPETDADLTVTVKRVPGGRVSGWLNDRVSPGDVLEATRPAGVFCVRGGERPLVALAAGSGITPVMSIARSVLATSTRRIRLLYANRDRSSVIFHDELAALSEAHPERLAVRHHLDAEGGFLDGAAVVAFVGNDRDADFYVCGPAPFMDLAEGTVLGLGIRPDQISIERFVNAGQPAPPPAPPPADRAAAVATETVTVILKGKRNTISYRPGDTVLETARRGGLQAPFSCEAGNCATCMALVHDGTATMRTNNALTPEEVAEGWILTCQALPQSPTLTVEYESF